MSEEKKVKKESKKVTSVKRKALRDFVICHNDYLLKIKKGDDLSKIPVKFVENLKAEKVL